MIKSDKVIIRPLEEDDAAAFYSWYNDPEINLWASGAWPQIAMLSKDEIWQRFFESDDEYRYTVLNESDIPIGTIGFKNFNVSSRSADLFIVIGEKNYWNKGYGTAALQLFITYLFQQWNLHRLMLDTWDGNERAIAIYKKLGFVTEGRLREACYVMGEYRDLIIMGLLKQDFLNLQKL